jgi:hypothetical protein
MPLCVAHARTRQRPVVALADAEPGGRSRVDPTGTTNIRRRWEADLVSRLGSLRGLVGEAIGNADLLGLSGSAQASVGAAVFARAFTPG